jgi:hypothetical protein
VDEQAREARRSSLVGATRSVRSLDWAELAAGDSAFFEQSLRELGLGSPAINRALERRSELEAGLRALDEEETNWRRRTAGTSYFGEPPELQLIARKRDSAYRSLWDILKGISVRVEETTQTIVWVPLFVLSAPDVPGCSVAFEASEMIGRALGWKITLIGGLSGGKEVRTTSTWKVTAEAGDIKQIKVPINLTLERAAVLMRGKDTGRRIYQVRVEDEDVEAAIPELIEGGDPPRRGDIKRRYRLSRDKPGAIFEEIEKYEQTGSRRAALDLKVFGAQVAFEAQVQQDENVALTYQLRGGHDYALHYVVDGDGYLWAS